MDAEDSSLHSDPPTHSTKLLGWEEIKHEYRKQLDKIILNSHVEADCEGILSYVKTVFHTDCGPLTGPSWNPQYFENTLRAAVEHAKQQQQGKQKIVLSRDSFEAVSTSKHWYSNALSRAKSKAMEATKMRHRDKQETSIADATSPL